MIEIKDRIMELRLTKGLTQSELAKELKLSPSSIGMYEQGRRKPSYKLLEKISDYFDVDMDFLMGKSDIKNRLETNKIIKKKRKELGLTLKQVADQLGVSESLISRYESNDVKNMGIDKIKPLAKILKCEPEYLMGWIDNKTSSEINPQNTYNFLPIPLYASISAGYGSCQAEFIEMLPVPGLRPNGTEYFAVKVVGDSMEPKIPNNSIIIIKKDIAIENGEIGAFCFNETSYVKQKRVVNGRLILHSFNLAYEPIVVTEYDDFKEYGKVVKVLIDL